MALPVDGLKILELYRFIVKGFIWHHWKIVLSESDEVHTMGLSEVGETYFNKLLCTNAGAKVEGKLGDDTFKYIGSQAKDSPGATIWMFTMYNGIKFIDNSFEEPKYSTKIGALTIPKNSGLFCR